MAIPVLEQSRWSSFKERSKSNGELIELVIKDFYASILQRGDNVIDGGAHTAYHTLPLADCVPNGKVIAVEPNPAVFVTLESKTSNRKNVVRKRAALVRDHAQETVTFNCSASHPGRSGLSRMWDRIAPGTVSYQAETVPATTIDNLVVENGLTSVAFIKLDLEGGEFPALLGAERTLITKRPAIVSEHASQAFPLNGYQFDDYLSFLERVGYTAEAPGGIRVTREMPYPFWYVLLCPVERREWPSIMGKCLEKHS